MNSVSEFIESQVGIEKIGDTGHYGHYPFSLYSEKESGDITLQALALGGNVRKCYSIFSEQVSEGLKRIYMSLDFPKNGDIKTDFVAIIYIEGDSDLKIKALPYNPNTGETFNLIEKSQTLDRIKNQLEYFL